MGTKRSAGPRPAVVIELVDPHGLHAALRLFVGSFVVDDKREQIRKRLLAAERRLETLETLPRWIAARTSPLDGADRSPAGLAARFGELTGVHLDAAGARRIAIAGVLELARNRPSLFIGDSGRIALITVERGAPLLCAPG